MNAADRLRAVRELAAARPDGPTFNAADKVAVDAQVTALRAASADELLRVGLRLVAELVYGPAEGSISMLMLRAGLWSGEIMRRDAGAT